MNGKILVYFGGHVDHKKFADNKKLCQDESINLAKNETLIYYFAVCLADLANHNVMLGITCFLLMKVQVIYMGIGGKGMLHAETATTPRC